MTVWELLDVVQNFGRFASIYCFAKCLKAMFCGTMLMPVLLLFRRALRGKNAFGCCYLMLMLLPTAFMGMSRFFYQKPLYRVTAVMNKHMLKAGYGYVYFGVMFALVIFYLARNRRLRRQLKYCPDISDAGVIKELTGTITSTDKTTFQRRYLKRVTVYLADTDGSPFSGGIWRPYVVVPRVVWEDWQEESRRAVLCHELMHIKSGHILWLVLFKALTCLWWANPLVYLCEAALKEDIELACDESCVVCAGIPKHTYGCVLLGMIEQLNGRQNVTAASFLDRNDFSVLRKRIGYLAGRSGGSRFFRGRRACFGVFAACMALVSAGIAATSYPRYTVLREFYVYDEDVNLIAGHDVSLVQETFSTEDGALYIDKEKFAELVATEHITDDYVYVSYDTIIKVPGMGGGGNVGMVKVSDPDDIFYLAADTLENKILIFCLKYL